MIQAKNIIFDLGGVIINIDYQKTIDAFIDLGIEDFAAKYTQAQQIHFFDDFEIGKISEDEFYNNIRSLTEKDISNQDIENAWNAMLINIPLRRLQILQQLQLHYNTVILSNTNSIHERRFNQMLRAICGFNTLGVLVDKLYYSHKIGLRKPNKEVFELVLNDTGFVPSETVFIEDSIQHIETAKSLGIQTIFIENGMTMEKDIFKEKEV